VAAFSVDAGDREQLILVAEMSDAEADTDQVKQAIRAAVRDQHAVEVQDVALVRRGSLPKTTSGKLQRGACRDRYIRGELTAV
jgi:acyl-CoA synthetase (AMP-forming)/AMP-acid ligase II